MAGLFRGVLLGVKHLLTASQTLSPAPLTPAPFKEAYWIQIAKSGSNKAILGARALGARAWALSRPGGPPGQVGSGLGRFGFRLDTVLAYRMQSIQNRAQTVKAKIHI